MLVGTLSPPPTQLNQQAAASLVERGVAESVIASELLHGSPSLNLLKKPGQLLVGEPQLLYA